MNVRKLAWLGTRTDDLAATAELQAAGVEVVQAPRHAPDGSAWVHLRAPDGNLYELTQESPR